MAYTAKIKEPKPTKTKKKLSGITIFEITWYVICGTIGLWGLVYMILGLIADYTSLSGLINFTMTIERHFGLDAFYWGMIILSIAVIAIVIALLAVNRVVERESEKASRREARLAHLKELEEMEENNIVEAVVETEVIETKNKEVIDVEIDVVEETKPDSVNHEEEKV